MKKIEATSSDRYFKRWIKTISYQLLKHLGFVLGARHGFHSSAEVILCHDFKQPEETFVYVTYFPGVDFPLVFHTSVYQSGRKAGNV